MLGAISKYENKIAYLSRLHQWTCVHRLRKNSLFYPIVLIQMSFLAMQHNGTGLRASSGTLCTGEAYLHSYITVTAVRLESRGGGKIGFLQTTDCERSTRLMGHIASSF